MYSNFKFRKFRNTANSKAEKVQKDRIKDKFRKSDNKQLSVGKVKLQTQKTFTQALPPTEKNCSPHTTATSGWKTKTKTL